MTSLSVLVPVRNVEGYLHDALESVRSQLAPNDEVLIQDGGSSDGTLRIAREFSRADSRFSVVSEPDSGQSDALARALSRANGDYIAWLNGDDLVSDDAFLHVRRALAVANQNDVSVDLVYGGFEIVGPDLSVLRRLSPNTVDRESLLRKGCFLFSGACYFKRETLLRVGFDSSFHYAMDYNLLLRICELDHFTGWRVESILARFRLRDDSKTGGQASRFVRDTLRARSASFRRMDGNLLRWWTFVAWPTLSHILRVYTTSLRHTSIYGYVRGRTRNVG